MKSVSCACVLATLAVAASGCGSGAGAQGLTGNYNVMISSLGKADPDVMTVAPGMDGTLLLTFSAGVLTDTNGPNPDGLVGKLHEGLLTVESQPAHIDHSTGYQDGSVTGSGVLLDDGSCDVTLHFSAPRGGAQEYEIAGTKL